MATNHKVGGSTPSIPKKSLGFRDIGRFALRANWGFALFQNKNLTIFYRIVIVRAKPQFWPCLRPKNWALLGRRLGQSPSGTLRLCRNIELWLNRYYLVLYWDLFPYLLLVYLSQHIYNISVVIVYFDKISIRSKLQLAPLAKVLYFIMIQKKFYKRGFSLARGLSVAMSTRAGQRS